MNRFIQFDFVVMQRCPNLWTIFFFDAGFNTQVTEQVIFALNNLTVS